MKLAHISNGIYYWKNRHDPECANAFSAIVWWCLLSASALFLLGAVLYSIWMLSDSAQVSGTEAVVGQSETLSREALRNTLDAFKQRQQQFVFVQNNPPAIKDPSR